MKFKPLACGYHSHTQYSLDSPSSAESKIIEASKQGRIADCVTDHGIMSGIMPHWQASNKLYKDKKIENKIISIHGIEAYVIDEDRPQKEFKNGKTEPYYYHLTIHFKTSEAYFYFCRLTPLMESRALIKYGERKPLIYLSELEPISGQIVIGSGCLLSPVQRNILAGRSDLARKNYIKLRDLAGPGNFFVEVFPHCIDREWQRPKYGEDKKSILEPGHFKPITLDMIRRDQTPIDPEPCSCPPSLGIDIQKNPNEFVLKMAEEFKDPVVISLDDHYSRKKDYLLQEMRMGNSTENWKFFGSYHMYTSDEAAEIFKKQLNVSDRAIEEWIDNSYKFVDLFKDYKMVTSKDRWLLPTTETVYGIQMDSKSKLMELIAKHGKMPSQDDPSYQVYKDRLDKEIEIMHDNGTNDFLPYVLLLEDIAEECRRKGHLLNLRGSGAGSLIYFLLSISITDPVKYNLPFERHLTIGRIASGSLPDADMDFEDRDFGIEYVKGKYGDRVCLIATDVSIKIKSAILDTTRQMRGYVTDEAWKVSKQMPNLKQGQSSKDFLFGKTDAETGEHTIGYLETPEGEELKKWSEVNADVWATVLDAIGIVKTRGVHPGGVVITPESSHNYFPMVVSKETQTIAYNMKGTEEAGGVKYDFLTVQTLKALSIAMKSIKEKEGVEIPWGEFPHDPEVYKNIIQSGKLVEIFQIHTHTMKPYVNKLEPKTIKELSNVIALVRPGAMDAQSPIPGDKRTAAEYYVDCVNGHESIHYPHPSMEPFLKHTMGMFLFQEQQAEVAKFILGIDNAGAEEFRRATAKKDIKLTEENCDKLRKATQEKGWTKDQSDKLISSFMAAANYSFNCIAGDQKIITDKGMVEFKEVADNIDKYSVLSQSPDGSVIWEKPIAGYHMGKKDIFEIHFEDSSRIKCTGDHRVKQKGEWRTTREIIEDGEYMADGGNVLAQIDSVGTDVSMNIVAYSILEDQDVYDISVPINQNFILENGAIAHNCGHSTSYAIVAYNCAYLKHYYPLHFWKGVLTIRSDDEDKLKEMFHECRDYILPVNVLKSHASEWMIEGNKLRSPLSLLKGCGEKGVQNLLTFITTPIDVILNNGIVLSVDDLDEKEVENEVE